AVRAGTMGRRADGGGIRRSSNRIWSMDRAQVRRIAGNYGKKLDSKTGTIATGKSSAAGRGARKRARSSVARSGPVDSRTDSFGDCKRTGGESFADVQRAEEPS